ncbi:vacuolar atpase assembly integral membrane protein vma21 [Venturia nashicola]|uniref:Vacuolar atpase assembly integral membrane protein vma21 n=1 Tax=Venturia nashicola TaxID=86259 RepID=A0A4Z1P657_9PEZI|nr:vacuolar atpase assembly integral membrane protein vma21 [Venturia nashicola]TLD24556.1 vacuolar atpase assembly integral membrane protein vma21 [Venturia nashicola]
MATRRNVRTDQTSAEKDPHAPADGPSDIRPAVESSVIYKLLAFTFAMVVFPISSYFLTVDTIFKGKSSYAGGFAAIIANVVLIGYVIVAMKEDQSDRLEAEAAAKKKE